MICGVACIIFFTSIVITGACVCAYRLIVHECKKLPAAIKKLDL